MIACAVHLDKPTFSSLSVARVSLPLASSLRPSNGSSMMTAQSEGVVMEIFLPTYTIHLKGLGTRPSLPPEHEASRVRLDSLLSSSSVHTLITLSKRLGMRLLVSGRITGYVFDPDLSQHM